ncbi:MAG: exonuclease subunit SbcD, partial [Sphingobacteriales bacterium]
DVLMISGDVFDQANPTNEARQLYYDFLRQLITLRIKVIITGGNHDAPGILNAPREILRMLDVHVVGSAMPEVQGEVIGVGCREGGKVEAVVAAVPYLREPDIHALTKDMEFEDKREQVRAAIRKHYELVAEACKDFTVPVIAMGHLYAAGSSVSDSERLIQMGNQSAVASDDFPSIFQYIALGHIHKPQFVNGLSHIRYSGSPVPLSFSERKDRKIVIELVVNGNTIEQVHHEVPVFRKLVRFSGSFEDVKAKVEAWQEEGLAKAYAELQIEEETMNPAVYADAARFVADWNSAFIDIVNYTIAIKSDLPRMDEISGGHLDLREIQPLEVLDKMMEAGKVSPEDQFIMRNAFLELLGMDDENEDE